MRENSVSSQFCGALERSRKHLMSNIFEGSLWLDITRVPHSWLQAWTWEWKTRHHLSTFPMSFSSFQMAAKNQVWELPLFGLAGEWGL